MFVTYTMKSESGDSYMGTYEVESKDENIVLRQIVEDHMGEIEYWIVQEVYDEEWALANPEEALKCSLLYPELSWSDSAKKIGGQ